MKRVTWVLGILIAAGVATAVAQPPGGPGGAGRGGPGGPGGPGGMRPPQVIEALDSDHDHVISADELKNATASLLTLDKNNDGKLTVDEFGPPGAGPATGRGQGGAGSGAGNRQGAGANNRRPQSGGQGGPNGPGGPGGPNGRGPGGGPPGGPGEGPDPERMVEHAMQFDANKDGKLSREELLKFAEDFVQNRPGPGGPGGPAGAGPNESGRPERPKRPEE